MTLTEFLAARLDEDEAGARAAPGEQWRSFREDDIAGASVYDEQWRLLDPARYDHNKPMSNQPGATGPQYIQQHRDDLAAHIARYDPARVLREVEAKRHRLERYLEQDGFYLPDGVEDGRDPDERLRDEAVKDVLEAEVEEDAAVYREHRDWRPEWAPLPEVS